MELGFLITPKPLTWTLECLRATHARLTRNTDHEISERTTSPRNLGPSAGPAWSYGGCCAPVHTQDDKFTNLYSWDSLCFGLIIQMSGDHMVSFTLVISSVTLKVWIRCVCGGWSRGFWLNGWLRGIIVVIVIVDDQLLVVGLMLCIVVAFVCGDVVGVVVVGIVNVIVVKVMGSWSCVVYMSSCLVHV